MAYHVSKSYSCVIRKQNDISEMIYWYFDYDESNKSMSVYFSDENRTKKMIKQGSSFDEYFRNYFNIEKERIFAVEVSVFNTQKEFKQSLSNSIYQKQ